MKYTLKKLQAIGRLYNFHRRRGIVVDNGVLFMLQLTEALMLELMNRRIKPKTLDQIEILDKSLKRDKILKRREMNVKNV